jgi:hypothetical protein
MRADKPYLLEAPDMLNGTVLLAVELVASLMGQTIL